MQQLTLTILAILTVIISACSIPNNPLTGRFTNGISNVDLDDLEIEYCKSILKEAKLEYESTTRKLELEKEHRQTKEDKVLNLKNLGDKEDIEEAESDLSKTNEEIESLEKDLDLARSTFLERQATCERVSDSDVYICKEFKLDIHEKMLKVTKAIQKNQEDLDDMQQVIEYALEDNEDREIIASIQRALQKRQFEVLRNTNQKDQLERMLEELERLCS
jgi:hypothetical protein